MPPHRISKSIEDLKVWTKLLSMPQREALRYLSKHKTATTGKQSNFKKGLVGGTSVRVLLSHGLVKYNKASLKNFSFKLIELTPDGRKLQKHLSAMVNKPQKAVTIKIRKLPARSEPSSSKRLPVATAKASKAGAAVKAKGRSAKNGVSAQA